MQIPELTIDSVDAEPLLTLRSNLNHVGVVELSSAVRNCLPSAAVQKLRAPTSSSVPLIVCTHPQMKPGLASVLALFSVRECGYAQSYEEISSQTELLPISVTSGPQLSEWFIEHIDQYYGDEVTRRLHSWGDENENFDPSHRPVVPIIEFASLSLEQSYIRLVSAVADLDDDGCAHDAVGHVSAVTHDAVAPAGVQFFHLGTDESVASCFVSFKQLVADAHRWVMF